MVLAYIPKAGCSIVSEVPEMKILTDSMIAENDKHDIPWFVSDMQEHQ